MSDEVIDKEVKYEPNLDGTDYRNFGVQIIPPSELYRKNYDRIFRKHEIYYKETGDPYSDKERLVVE